MPDRDCHEARSLKSIVPENPTWKSSMSDTDNMLNPRCARVSCIRAAHPFIQLSNSPVQWKCTSKGAVTEHNTDRIGAHIVQRAHGPCRSCCDHVNLKGNTHEFKQVDMGFCIDWWPGLHAGEMHVLGYGSLLTRALVMSRLNVACLCVRV